MTRLDDVSTWPPRRTPPTLVFPRAAVPVPRPAPELAERSRSGGRRTVVLLASLLVGLAAGGGAAVLQQLVTSKGRGGVAPRAVAAAIRPLGTRTVATRDFSTEVQVRDPELGDEVTYRGVGQVAATVDFGRVGTGDVRVAPDGTVTVTVAAVALGTPTLDEGRSGVVRGPSFLDSLFGSSVSEDDLRAQAVDAISSKASASDLSQQGADAAAALVRHQVARLRVARVDVRFV